MQKEIRYWTQLNSPLTTTAHFIGSQRNKRQARIRRRARTESGLPPLVHFCPKHIIYCRAVSVQEEPKETLEYEGDRLVAWFAPSLTNVTLYQGLRGKTGGRGAEGIKGDQV